MNIGIFCSANNNISREYFERSAELAHWCAANGHGIVFGGCNAGLMGCVAEAFNDATRVQSSNGFNGATRVQGSNGNTAREQGKRAQGGQLIGVVPRIIEQGGRTSEHLTVHIPCDNLSDRKDLMLAHSDVLVALPGGIGTLDEVFTVAAAHTIGYHRKPVILYNIAGFWNSLIALLDDLQQRGMIRGRWTDYISVVSSTQELALVLENMNG